MYDLKQEYFAKILLFKPQFYNLRFLEYVVCRDHSVIEKMLKAGVNVLFDRGSLTDYSGRAFSNISGFEYALWAKDKHMWTLMLDFVKQLPNDERLAVVNKLRAQYEKIKIEGITYTLKAQVITERHFDFEGTIIQALHTQVETQNFFGTQDLAQWTTGVGGAQKLLPMHVVNEYCSETPFSPTPDFINAPLMLKSQFNISNGCQDWFTHGSKLGVEFAIIKGDSAARRYGRGDTGAMQYAEQDLMALETLCKVRTEDFINLEVQLEELLQVDYQPVPIQG